MAIREGRWDCTRCGTIGNLGRHLFCPNCGDRRAEGVRFYLPTDEQIIEDESRLRTAKAGADWICPYCGSSNPATAPVCTQCGAEKGDAGVQQVGEYSIDQVPRSGDNAPKERSPQAIAQQPPGKGKTAKIIGGAALALIALFALLAVLARRTSETTVAVAGLEWERTISIEKFVPVIEEDWTLPKSGKLLSQRQDVHHHNQILDHYKTGTREVSEQVKTGTRTYVCGQRDLGNGYFEDKTCTEPVYETRTRKETYREPVYRKEPVYQTKYKFEIYKWLPDRTEKKNGNDHNAAWPETNLVSNQRELNRTEKYIVTFRGTEQEQYRLVFPFERWKQFEVGKTIEANTRSFGSVLEIEGGKQE